MQKKTLDPMMLLRRPRLRELLLLLPVFPGACATSVEVIDPGGVPADVRAEARKIRLIGAVEPRGYTYEPVSPIEATSCKRDRSAAPATMGNALEQLRIKAHRIGANAVSGVSCARTGIDYRSNCWQSIVCSGTAIRLTRSFPGGGGGSGESSGSGFFVNGVGNVLTNAHVVAACTQIRVRVRGKVLEAQLVATDRANDLAVLRTDASSEVFLTFGKGGRPRLSEEVIVLGYPLQRLLSDEMHATSGDITALSGMRGDRRLIQISAPVQPGNSGGPVIDRSGNIVGVTVSKLDAIAVAGSTGDIPQNVNFAIRAELVKNFLNTHNVRFSTGTTSALLKKPELVEKVGPATVPVQCRRR